MQHFALILSENRSSHLSSLHERNDFLSLSALPVLLSTAKRVLFPFICVLNNQGVAGLNCWERGIQNLFVSTPKFLWVGGRRQGGGGKVQGVARRTLQSDEPCFILLYGFRLPVPSRGEHLQHRLHAVQAAGHGVGHRAVRGGEARAPHRY